MIKRIGCCHLCGNRPILEIPLKNGVDFGHTPDLPNEAAQWATIYGIMNPTHRRSHQGILVTLLNNSWLHLLGDPAGPSVNVLLPSRFILSLPNLKEYVTKFIEQNFLIGFRHCFSSSRVDVSE